jgi:hypothetical protein
MKLIFPTLKEDYDLRHFSEGFRIRNHPLVSCDLIEGFTLRFTGVETVAIQDLLWFFHE